VPLPTTIIITTPWGRCSVLRPREAFIAPSDPHVSLPSAVTMQRWYLDDGVFMCPMAEFEGVLAALQQALPPRLGLELNMRKITVWGPEPGASDVPSPRRHTPASGRGNGGAGSPL